MYCIFLFQFYKDKDMDIQTMTYNKMGKMVCVIILIITVLVMLNYFIKKGCSSVVPSTIKGIGKQDKRFQGKLRDYYIKSSFNSCSRGKFQNDWVNLCALENVISQGCRVLDFEIYDIDVKFDDKLKPFLSLGAEVTKKLKNKDLLLLKLSYDHSFLNAYNGTYSIYDGNSTGQYFNRGSFLNVSIGYVITGNKKLNRIKELQTLNHVDPKKAKKLLRKENRFIDPKSSFLNISGGTGFGGTKVHTDPNGSLENYAYPTFLPRISFEKGIKNNIYWEIGMHSQLFYDVTKFTIARYSSSGSGVFYAVQLSGGGLYRWVLKNNYNVINIHTGLSIGFHGARNDKNGIHSWGSGGMNGTINGNPVVYDYSSVSSVKSNVLTSLYLGLSKDFKIVNNFYFTLNYRQQVGLYKVYESTYNYSGLSVPTTIGAKTKITSSSKDFQFGFKIKLK